MEVSLSSLLFILAFIVSNAAFLFAGYYMGSRFKIVEIGATEQVRLLNNNPEEDKLKQALKESEERYREQYRMTAQQYGYSVKDEAATVPGEEDD